MGVLSRFGDDPAARRPGVVKLSCVILEVCIVVFPEYFSLSGRSAAWLARLVRDQEVEGSNPFAPTTLIP